MKTVSGTWSLPTTRVEGGPLPVDEIQESIVEMSADSGANFTEIARIPAAQQQAIDVPDLEFGEWIFRISIVDTDGRVGNPYEEVVMVSDTSPPGLVTNVVFTVS